MSVLIGEVVSGSICDKIGICKGDSLIAINNNYIADVLDYEFYCSEEDLMIEIEKSGDKKQYSIEKEEDESLGLIFDTYLMDKHKTCKNKCIFCFIDQMPKGRRESLYFKDDDSRLSFLFGNYITLTNLTEHEADRIIKMKISPINISIHTTNPELRVKMMGNKNSGESLKHVENFVKAGISINCQLVLCPGINDGLELKKTIETILGYGESVQSVACVPIGITKFRDNLHKMEIYDQQTAAETIDIIESYGNASKKERGFRKFYPSDEFFLIAKRKLPDYDYYDDFVQLSNGVGMITMFEREFFDGMEYIAEDNIIKQKISIATGYSAYEMIKGLIGHLSEKYIDIDCQLHRITNNFFGETITVSGLLTATDLIDQLKDKDLGEYLLLTESMIKQDGDQRIFLDDISVEQVEKILNVKIKMVANDGNNLLENILY